MNIEQYWSTFLGIDQQQFETSNIIVVSHAALSGYWGIWIFIKGNSVTISSPDSFVPICEQLAQNRSAGELSDMQVVGTIFKEYADCIVGPAYHGTLNNTDFRPAKKHEAREISFDETQAINDARDPTGWEDSGSGEAKERYFGVYFNEQLVAVSNYSIYGKVVAFPGVYVHPQFRGQGHSTTALSIAFKSILSESLLMDYQTLCSNVPSIKTAERLGVREFARHIAIRLKGQ